jgi:peptidoglycan/LPS O-acetylase OafA/YrhL
MTGLTNQKTERQYYIDWLRILLILSVFLFHNGMVFNTWSWHIKNDIQYDGILEKIMTFLHYWRMPLLFMVSGAGTYFALGKRTPGQYLSERSKRLLIPLVIGMFTLVPVQVYIEKISQYNSLPDFYTHMFNGIYPGGNFSWHHLWFIAYLFVISLFISPFLNLLRSKGFESFTHRIERTVTKPLALNIFIIPLLLSQVLLRPYFEVGTNALVDDWASITYYILFFLAGYTLLPVRNITEAIRKQRFWYLAEAAAVTAVMFTVPGMIESEGLAGDIRDVSSIFVAWSCAITAIGFAKQHLNTDSPFRKLANEAIYPFYLLHQPAIVVTGYFIIQWNVPVLWKAVVILFTSFSLAVAVYWFLIRPYNLSRFIFGMKCSDKETKKVHISKSLEPAIVKNEIQIQFKY